MTDRKAVIAWGAAVALLGSTACARKVRVESSPSPGAQAEVRNDAGLNRLRAQLRNMGSAQEIFYSNPANSYTYAKEPRQLPNMPVERGVTVTILEATPRGWSAIARSDAGDCVMFMGEVSKPVSTSRGTAASRSGMSVCDAAMPK